MPVCVAEKFYDWCKDDQHLIDERFRTAGQMRPKWDEYRGSQTY